MKSKQMLHWKNVNWLERLFPRPLKQGTEVRTPFEINTKTRLQSF